jgi:hypothetical protein
MPAPGSGPRPAGGQAPAGIQQAGAAANGKCRLGPSLRWGDGDCGDSVWSTRALFPLHYSHADPPPGQRSGTGRGVRERRTRRCNIKSRLTGAPTRRLKVSIPRFFSLKGAPVVVPEGWGKRPPGRSGPCPAGDLAWRAPTGAGAVPSPRGPGGPDNAPSGEGMGGVYGICSLVSRNFFSTTRM